MVCWNITRLVTLPFTLILFLIHISIFFTIHLSVNFDILCVPGFPNLEFRSGVPLAVIYAIQMPSGSRYHWTYLNVNISACIYLYESNWFSNILFLDWTKRWLNHARFTSTIHDLRCRNWNKKLLSYIMCTFGQTSQELFCECIDIEIKKCFIP